jgi:acyl-[acyl-carrier-protein] desaturase
MREEGGINRQVFIQKVYLPILKFLGVSRHDMLSAQRAALQARGERDPSELPTRIEVAPRLNEAPASSLQV